MPEKMLETAAIDDFEAIGPGEDGPGAGLTLLALKAGRIGFANYAYVVGDRVSGAAVVIDPGFEAAFLLDRLAGMGLKPEAVLLTHGHRDHTDAACAIARDASCPVYMARTDAAHLRFTCEQLIPIEADQTLRFGAILVEALHTPGHTAGSFSFRVGDCLFTGDTLFSEGCGLSNPANGGGDTEALFRSLHRLRSRLSPACRIFPGHRYHERLGQRFDALERGNIYLRFREINAFTRFCERPARMNQTPPPMGSVPLMRPDLTPLAEPGLMTTKRPDAPHHAETEQSPLRRAG